MNADSNQSNGLASGNLVKNTYWAKADRIRYDDFRSHIPAVVETELHLWQRRVDRNNTTKYLPHSYLYTITALRYAVRADGVFAPVEPNQSMSFLVAAETRRDATERVLTGLVAHGYERSEWAICINGAILVLKG
jgi:hypothetical protein